MVNGSAATLVVHWLCACAALPDPNAAAIRPTRTFVPMALPPSLVAAGIGPPLIRDADTGREIGAIRARGPVEDQAFVQVHEAVPRAQHILGPADEQAGRARRFDEDVAPGDAPIGLLEQQSAPRPDSVALRAQHRVMERASARAQKRDAIRVFAAPALAAFSNHGDTAG